MGVYLVDVSNHQPDFDFNAAVDLGFEGGIFKISEGSTFKDRYFHRHWNAAGDAGMTIRAGYHYQRTDSVSSQVANIMSMVGNDVPVILDVESGSGGVDITRGIVAALRSEGYHVPLSYIPRWYWNQIGRPDLSGLPPLWASDYRAYPDWSDYGGNWVALQQYTSTPYDRNFTPLNYDVFAALIAGTDPGSGGGGGGGEEDDMYSDGDRLLAQAGVARTTAIARLQRTEQDGPNAGDAVPLVDAINDLAYRVEAMFNLRDTQAGGPNAGAEVPLTKVIKEIQAKLATIAVGGVDYEALADAILDRQAQRLEE